MKKRKILISLSAILILTGCSETMIAKMIGLENPSARTNRGYQTPKNLSQKITIKKITNLSESILKNNISQYPKVNIGVKFDKRMDGFTINGDDIYVDPEGQIVNYGYNWKDGSFFYLVQVSATQYKIKFNRVNSNKESMDIAYVEKRGGNVSVQTVTGKNIKGNGLILTSVGFLVIRGDTAFIYTAGEGQKTFKSPSGWHIADFQNGDVASTNFLLLEKTVDKASAGNSFKALINSTKELFQTIGLTTKEDYMLISLDDNSKQYLFDITLGDKEIALYSQCRQSKHKYIDYCDKVDFRQSVFQPNGLKNFSHYYWNINWFRGKNTIFSITKEASHAKVLIRDLNTGKIVKAAYRLTGFPEFQAKQDSDGVVKIHVSGGLFPNVDIEDSEQFLAKNENDEVAIKDEALKK